MRKLYNMIQSRIFSLTMTINALLFLTSLQLVLKTDGSFSKIFIYIQRPAYYIRHLHKTTNY